nr:hypothetical protein [uncultured bacterium]
MKNYATVAFRKIKGAEQFNGLEIHNTREILSKNIHPHLTHTNICLKKITTKIMLILLVPKKMRYGQKMWSAEKQKPKRSCRDSLDK